jgi:DNA repair protein RadA/Sms
VEEPAADLAVVAAVASSVRNRALRPGTAVFGEVGLAGEIRAVAQAEARVREAAQLGFPRVVLPAGNLPTGLPPVCELTGVESVTDALDLLMAW